MSSHLVESFMDLLPEELHIDIFLRLPPTSLLICRRVCKLFLTVIQNPDFQNTYVTRNISFTTADTSHSLILQFGHIYNSHILVSIDNTTKDVISYKPLTPPIPLVGRLDLVGSSNGLICFKVIEAHPNIIISFLLWNPVTGQTRYIPKPIPIPEPGNIGWHSIHKAMEFYYVPGTNDYNILSIGFADLKEIQVGLYKMSMNSWTVVDGISFSSGFAHIYSPQLRNQRSSVFMNGSFHWIFTSLHADCSHVVTFNLKSEKLRLFKTIDHEVIYPPFSVSDIMIIGESLALIYSHHDHKDFQIWVMNDYGVEDSWVLKFKLSNNNVCRPVAYWGSNLLVDDYYSLYFYDDTNPLEEKKLCKAGKAPFTAFCSFLDTLAPIG